jgi:ABC-type transport system involved in multi-copper enzyme maturation permease subunit
MSLFRFELKKLLFNKKTLILLTVLLILYAAIGFLVSHFSFGGQSNYTIYRELADAHTGPIDPVQAAASNKVSDDTKIRFGNNSDALSEAGYHDPVIKFNLNYADYAKYADEYYNGASTDSASAPYGINNLQKKVDSLEQNGDSSSFEYRKTVRQLETETSIGEPVFDNTSLWVNLFNNWGTYIVLFLLFIPLGFIIAPVFSIEASTGMDNLILSSMHGRKKIVTAKLVSVIITSAVVVMIYVAATFFANFLAMGSFAGATAALRSVAAYARAPFAMDVWQFAVVSVLWLLFMGIVFGIVVAFVSSKIKSQLGTFGIGLADRKSTRLNSSH